MGRNVSINYLLRREAFGLFFMVFSIENKVVSCSVCYRKDKKDVRNFIVTDISSYS
jgi:hypothetical protein